MLAKPYVGITGSTTIDEVTELVSQFEEAGYGLDSPHIPMLGFLVSKKTLDSLPMSNRRYPKFSDVRGLLEVTRCKTFNMIHYNSRELDLTNQLEKIFDGIYQDGLCRSVQLNIVYPEIEELEKFKQKMPELQVVFQASQHVLRCQRPQQIAERISEYGQTIDYVLIDPSGGKGKEFKIEDSVNIYNELREKVPHVTIGFAGGFTGDNVQPRVLDIRDKINSSQFCIDAEGGLRDKITDAYGDDTINLVRSQHFLKCASKVLP